MAKVEAMSGVVHSDGSCILQYTGLANIPVTWSILSGGGSISSLSGGVPGDPSQGATNTYGLAYGKYDAGGYVGQVVIEVTIGS